VLEHLRLILALRAAGYSLGDIACLSLEGPPTIEILRRRLAQLDAERTALPHPHPHPRSGALALLARQEPQAATAR
jgi:DNA-binding transcriptional MerR regulator